MTKEDFDLTDYDIQILRVLNGEDVPDVSWGAAMGMTCEFLRSRGLAKGCYEITEKGKQVLNDLVYTH